MSLSPRTAYEMPSHSGIRCCLRRRSPVAPLARSRAIALLFAGLVTPDAHVQTASATAAPKQTLFKTYSVAEGVGDPHVYATYVDRSGVVWLGTGKGASRLDPVAGRATVLGTGKNPVSVNALYQDASGAMWIGTARGEGGLLRCAPPAMTCNPDGIPELRDRAVFALYGDVDGPMWVGASGMVFRHDGIRWTGFETTNGGKEVAVRVFASTHDGAVWMGTNGAGLWRFDAGSFTRITSADGLPSDLIRSLYTDADGWLWVGTEGGGLARLDPLAWRSASPGSGKNSSRRIARVGTKDGLFDDVIHQILEDDSGRLWMNTNHGIFWVARAELNAYADKRVSRVHSTAYGERDGIRNLQGNGGVQPAGARGPDGRLWFPTQDGVVVVDPRDVVRDRPAPPRIWETGAFRWAVFVALALLLFLAIRLREARRSHVDILPKQSYLG